MNKMELENTCYVLVQINKTHPIAFERFNLAWYPERTMTFLECVQYRPYVKSIVTENPWLISCYDSENVRVWHKEHGWVRPNDQTYCASVNGITIKLLGVHQTVPSVTFDGGTAVKKLIEKLEDSY